MCRYNPFEPYKTTFACVGCRRAAKHPVEARPVCPDCAGPMTMLGRDAHIPRRLDVREWRKIGLLVDAGPGVLDPMRRGGPVFDSCGCGGPGAAPRTLADAISQLGMRRSARRAPAVRVRQRIGRSYARR